MNARSVVLESIVHAPRVAVQSLADIMIVTYVHRAMQEQGRAVGSC